MAYSKCLNCSSESIVPEMSVEDDTNAYSAREHKVSFHKSKSSRLFNKNMPTRVLKAYVCGECGYTAFFAESPQELFDHYSKNS